MNPTIKDWNVNPTDVGPLYPFVGWEMPMLIACVLSCGAFMVWKFAMENKLYAAKAIHLRESGELADTLDD